ncbi:MAG: AraC family transcriptional regulator [Blautia sp.]|mgnify:CR=1 FL=1|nr:AraC family transcriptional regulator [Blautia sp.]
MKLNIDNTNKEIKQHGSYDFPFRLSHEKLSYFETHSFPWHWHTEFEITLVLEGDITYHVNENKYHLNPGDILFCNTNTMHAGYKACSDDCHYLSMTFHPRLVYGSSSSILYKKYIAPITGDNSVSSVYLEGRLEETRILSEEFRNALDLYEKQTDHYEIELMISILKMWKIIYSHCGSKENNTGNERDTERIRTLIEYVQKHYPENITLEDLAGEIHLCRSESCRLFRRYMNQTMFDYLLNYRIEQSLDLLKNSNLNITQIALQVGFSTPGYYTRLFRGRMGITPVQYRKQLLRT